MISQAFYNSLIYNAKRRKHKFDLEYSYLNRLLDKQDYKCAISGRPLIMPPPDHKSKRDQYNLSLDRINPKEGYIIGNIQWVDKNINMCKQSLTMVEFIHLCQEVVDNNG